MKTHNYYLILSFLLIFATPKGFSQVQNITVNSERNQDNSISLNFEKKSPGSYSIALEFSNVSNCDITDFRTVIYGKSGALVKLRPLNVNYGISYAMKYYSVLGRMNPRVDSLFYYLLPFKNGKKVTIYEANDIGEKYFGSEKALNWKSYVMKSKAPDTIYSMRKGIVVAVNKEHNNNSSENAQYTSKRNLIIVEHEDGTFAQYKGFKKEAIFVNLGQEIYPQTTLGVIEKYDNDNYRLDFSIYYLFDKDFISNRDQSLKDYKSNYKYLNPYFVTEQGTIQLEPKRGYLVSEGIQNVIQVDLNNAYTVLATEKEITKEFSRSEKKKYLKDSKMIK